jgi:hypothetical protein
LKRAFRQELESDQATEPGVLGLIDHPHATATKLFEDVIVRDKLAHHKFLPRVSAKSLI